MERTVLLVGTLDTKGAEYAYLRERLRLHGVDAHPRRRRRQRAGRRREPDVSREQVAAETGADPAALRAGGRPRRRGDGDGRGRRGARRAALYAEGTIGGVLAAGGSGGTAIATRAMRALPVGVPKLMVSTMAAGDTADYVGASDVTLMASVTDVAGVNSISGAHPRQRRGRDGRACCRRRRSSSASSGR